MPNVHPLPASASKRALVTAARQIAEPLHGMEDGLHEALANQARLMLAMLSGRAAAGIRDDRVTETLDQNLAIGQKLLDVVRLSYAMHRGVLDHGRKAGLVLGYGDFEETFEEATSARLAS